MNTPKNSASEHVLSLAARKLNAPQAKNMIAVASGKGGVGKTWFSITLAHALAQNNLKTLLFDGDLGLANIDIQLGLMPSYDLGSVFAGKITLNQAVCSYVPGGFDIIAGRSGSGSLSNVPLSRLQLINEDLRILATRYDRVIVDLGAGVDRPVRLFASTAATLLIVCTDEPTSLTDAYAFIKMVCMEHSCPNVKIIINSANSVREGERTYATLLKACQGFLRISPPLAGVIRRDTRVRDAIRNQASILTRHPATEAAEDVLSVAARLNKEMA